MSHSPNSALYWLPRILLASKTASIIPKTRTVEYDHRRLIDDMEGVGDYPEWDEVVQKVGDAADIIGWPVFLRTDLTSCKHDGPRYYKAEGRGDLSQQLCHTAEDSELKLFLMAETPTAFLVREFLELEAPIHAFRGLPVAREWRFFTRATGITCAHPYWPREALENAEEFLTIEPPQWRDLLVGLHERPPDEEWYNLCSAATRAARLCDAAAAWSVDFARCANGRWYLIDMAVAEQSWHWPGCTAMENFNR